MANTNNPNGKILYKKPETIRRNEFIRAEYRKLKNSGYSFDAAIWELSKSVLIYEGEPFCLSYGSIFKIIGTNDGKGKTGRTRYLNKRKVA